MGTYVFRLQTLHLLMHKGHSCLESKIKKKKNRNNVCITFVQPLLQKIAKSNTYSGRVCVCVRARVCVALGIQHAVRIDHIVICGLSGYTIFSILSHKQQVFRKQVIEYKMCFDFLYNFCLKHFSFQEELSEIQLKIHIDVHVNYAIFLSGVTET